MKKKFKKFLALIAVSILLTTFNQPSKAYALNIIDVDLVLFTTSGTPVFTAPDAYASIVQYLDRFAKVHVTGITDTGFYRVQLDNTYYIPCPFLVSQIQPEKTDKQKAIENLENITEAYRIQLGFMASYSPNFALVDVTGDGIPEIFASNDKEIYTYYEGRPVMIYFSASPLTFYYSKATNTLYGNYKWNEQSIWEVYYKDTGLLPWGQLRCYTTAPSAPNATKITKEYTNDDATRNDLYNILYKKIIDE